MADAEPGARIPARRQNAQTITEFALVLPLFIMLMMGALQVAFFTMGQLSLAWVSHNMVRYVATGSPERWRLSDTCHTTHRNSILPPILRPSNFTQFTYTPAYTPGTASCTKAEDNVPAADKVTPPRIRGGAIRITAAYNPTNLTFLPETILGFPLVPRLEYTAQAVME